jgi:predicted TIM-barrel fold metal-dependent hydrolase
MNKIVDFHAHIYPHKISDKAAESVGNFYGIQMDHGGSAEELIESGNEGEISNFVVHSAATTPQQVQSINDFIAQTCEKNGGRMIGLGTLHPDMENPEQEIERCISLGLKGFKLHPDFQKFNIDDERMLPIYKMMEGKLPILFHCGDYRYDYSHPRRLANVLDEFPKLDVIAAHFGGWSLYDLAVEYLENRRCWLDTSSALAFLGSRRGRELIRLYGADRMLFGTDFPMWSHKQELERFHNLELTEEENRKILYQNACEVLKMDV